MTVEDNIKITTFKSEEEVRKLSTEKIEPKIRTFDTGATRDTNISKLNYIKALCPLVLRRYVQYLDKHRLQPDGSIRDFDNWKKGVPKQTYMEGLGRHELSVWLLHFGYDAFDNHGRVAIEDALCAVIFNATGYLHEILKVQNEVKAKNKTLPWVCNKHGTASVEDGDQCLFCKEEHEKYLARGHKDEDTQG
jgi:hypothetical protein